MTFEFMTDEVSLNEVAEYRSEKVNIDDIDLSSYVSTENLVPEFGGKALASGLPSVKKVQQFNPGDILVSNIRPYFRKIWFAGIQGGASNDVLVIKNRDNIYNEYLYYSLANRDFFEFVMSGAKGTKMPRGDKNHIMTYKIKLPPLQEQKAIAHILSTLDEKIEVNNRINKTLEEMAQAIFKHWFVDFEFPNEDGEPYKSSGGEMVHSELGPIPKGWEVKRMSELCEISSSKRIFANEYVEEGIPFYRGKEIIEKSKGNNISTELYITEERYLEIKEKYEVPKEGDMLLTSVGTLGIPYLVVNEVFYFKDGNLTWFRKFLENGYRELIYLWIKSDRGREVLDSITIGSTQKALTISTLNKIKLAICDDDTLRKFYVVNKSFIYGISHYNQENRKLSSIRDTLLPKLMSGEIRVPLDNEE